MAATRLSDMDLNRSFPRSPTEKMAGLVHLPRMLDKARAKRNDTLGEYIYPCPLDDILLEFLGVDGDGLADRAGSQPDADIARWAAEQCGHRSEAEKEALNRSILDRKPDTDERRKKFIDARDKIAPNRQDITTWVGLIDLEEGRL